MKRAVAGGTLACLAPTAILVVCGALLVALFPSCEFPDLGSGLAFGDCSAEQPSIHRAARDGRVDDLQMLLDAGADPDALDHNGNTALGCALAIPNSPPPFGQPVLPDGTPLAVAQSDAIVAALLDHGADPNRDTGSDQFLETPIGLAWRRHRTEAAELLLVHGADPTRRDCRGVALASVATEPGTLVTMVMHGWNPNGSGQDSPAVIVAAAGNPEALRALVDHGADLALPSRRWPSLSIRDEALFVAAGGISEPMVDLLLAEGPPVPPPLAPRLLPAATAGFSPAVTERLLAAGIAPDVGSMHAGDLALLASIAPYTSVAFEQPLLGTLPDPTAPRRSVAELLPHLPPGPSPQPNPPDPRLDKCSPSETGGQPLPPEAYAALPETPNSVANIPPVVIASMNATTDDLAVLLDHGADPNIVILDRFTPLELAAMDCNVEAAAMLLDHGADPTLAPGGRRAGDVACPAVAELLA